MVDPLEVLANSFSGASLSNNGLTEFAIQNALANNQQGRNIELEQLRAKNSAANAQLQNQFATGQIDLQAYLKEQQAVADAASQLDAIAAKGGQDRQTVDLSQDRQLGREEAGRTFKTESEFPHETNLANIGAASNLGVAGLNNLGALFPSAANLAGVDEGALPDLSTILAQSAPARQADIDATVAGTGLTEANTTLSQAQALNQLTSAGAVRNTGSSVFGTDLPGTPFNASQVPGLEFTLGERPTTKQARIGQGEGTVTQTDEVTGTEISPTGTLIDTKSTRQVKLKTDINLDAQTQQEFGSIINDLVARGLVDIPEGQEIAKVERGSESGNIRLTMVDASGARQPDIFIPRSVYDGVTAVTDTPATGAFQSLQNLPESLFGAQ